MTIKAIPTEYRGTTFRSRLEADWAATLDHHGVRWIYEPEGYQLPSGICYSPDFYLPRIDVWLEVKGAHNAGVDRTIEFDNALWGERYPIFSPGRRVGCRTPDSRIPRDRWNAMSTAEREPYLAERLVPDRSDPAAPVVLIGREPCDSPLSDRKDWISVQGSHYSAWFGRCPGCGGLTVVVPGPHRICRGCRAEADYFPDVYEPFIQLPRPAGKTTR